MSSHYIIDMRPISEECARMAHEALGDASAWLYVVEKALSYDPFAPHSSYYNAIWRWMDDRLIPDITLAQLAVELITETSVSYVVGKIQDRTDVESSWSRAKWIRPGLLDLELI